MEDREITKNLVYLTKHLTNLHDVLTHLVQDGIMSTEEREEIESEKTTSRKNTKLLILIPKKDWPKVRDSFIEILRQTNNEHCADKIEGKESATTENKGGRRVIRKCEKILKWWPEKKRLIESLHERKYGGKLLVEELHHRIQKDKNRMVVICESAEAKKYSGMGGIGKTLTAKWYAHHYEEFYDHILWIDCGEGSLIKSFKNLARDLEVKNRKELLEVEEFARKCFEILLGFRCLWIYDNAEKYKGEEGVIKIIPNYQHFVFVITSRSREWGTENIDFGKISDLPLGIFSQEESFEFLQTKLKKEIKWTEFELNELCRLLGNLPLALQLTVAALNNSHMDVKTYIEKSKFVKVLDTEFDDYERTINGNVKVSLDLIEKQEFGKTANDILTIFGYIRPDYVQLEFLQSALQIQNDKQIKESAKLLINYSLIAKTKRINWWSKEKEVFLSIHRLLQQVIRENRKEKEKEILKKILGCAGFIDYKLLPFLKFADENLKTEFPKVKAELLDQKQLERLKAQKRFDECVQLATFIDQELQSNATKLNYAICLHNNGQLDECVKTAEELLAKIPFTAKDDLFSRAMCQMLVYLKTINFQVNIKRYYRFMDLQDGDNVSISDEMTLQYLLFFSYLRLNKYDRAIVIGKQAANQELIFEILTPVMEQKRFNECIQLAKLIDQQFMTNTTKLNYAICLQKSGQLGECFSILKELYHQEMKEEIKYNEYNVVEIGLMKLGVEVCRKLIGGHLLLAHWTMDNKQEAKETLDKRKQFIMIYSLENLGILIPLVHSDLINSNYYLTTDHSLRLTSFIDLKLDMSVKTKKIELKKCSLSLDSFDRLSPEELTLHLVSYYRDGQELLEVKVNDFVDLTNIKRLKLQCTEKKTFVGKERPQKNVILDLSEGSLTIDYLQLEKVRVLNWSNCSWNVTKLELFEIDFVEKTNINVQEIAFGYVSSLDVCCLPQTTQKITLQTEDVFSSGGVDLPNLKHLTLKELPDVGCLSHFHSATLKYIHLHMVEEVNVDLLPPTVTHLQLTESFDHDTISIVGGVRKLNNLKLKKFSFEGVEECLSHLHTDNLLIHYDDDNDEGIKDKELLQLMNKGIKTVIVGKINWHWWKGIYLFEGQLDRQADYYFLEGGRGTAMDRKQFKQHFNSDEDSESDEDECGVEEQGLNKDLQLEDKNYRHKFKILIENMKENKWSECVELTRCIDQDLSTNTTKFNYAICLDKNGQTKECIRILEDLYEDAEETKNTVGGTCDFRHQCNFDKT